MRRPDAAALVFVLAAEGCFPHVRFPPAPDRQAPLAVRQATYRRMHPVVGRAFTMPAEPHLMLADGTQVAHPEDLSPLVDPASRTARSAERHLRARRAAHIVTWSGLALVLVGGFLALRSVIDPVDQTLLRAGGAVAIVGAVTELVGLFVLHARANRVRAEAFDAFDASLRQRLRICGEGAQVIACPSTPAAEPPSPPRISN